MITFESGPAANSNDVLVNLSLPFMLESSGIRGRFVRLSDEINTILTGHSYPELLSQQVGELVVLTAMLGSMIKLDGKLYIQAKGDGLLDFIAADYTGEGHLRGYAKIRDQQGFDKLDKNKKPTINELMGKGFIIISIEQSGAKPYQSVIPLEGADLTACIVDYFKQSAQLESNINVHVERGDHGWVAAGTIIQTIPIEGGKTKKEQKEAEEKEDQWNTACVFNESARPEELLDIELAPNTLLYRLFHEEGVRVFDHQSLIAQCPCSREKMHRALTTLAKDELEELKQDGRIEVVCQFCNNTEYFTDQDINTPTESNE